MQYFVKLWFVVLAWQVFYVSSLENITRTGATNILGNPLTCTDNGQDSDFDCEQGYASCECGVPLLDGTVKGQDLCCPYPANENSRRCDLPVNEYMCKCYVGQRTVVLPDIQEALDEFECPKPN